MIINECPTCESPNRAIYKMIWHTEREGRICSDMWHETKFGVDYDILMLNGADIELLQQLLIKI